MRRETELHLPNVSVTVTAARLLNTIQTVTLSGNTVTGILAMIRTGTLHQEELLRYGMTLTEHMTILLWMENSGSMNMIFPTE